MVPTLVGLSILIFFVSRILPGDPARLALGPDATKEQVQKLRKEMGLDDPLHIQYLTYVQGLLHGDWGKSLITHRNVLDDLKERLSASIELTTAAMILAIIIGIPLGVIASNNKDRWEDNLSRAVSFAGVSMPRFWVGILLQILVYLIISRFYNWPIFGRIGVDPPRYITGLYTVDSLLTLNWSAFSSSLKHLMLPAFTLSLASIAQITRMIRASMIEQSRKDYILAAKAFGLPSNLIVYKYMLKNAFSSTLTVIGMIYGFLLGNAFLVEAVFSWPGLAGYGIKAVIHFKDFNAITGVVIVIGVMFLLVNFIVDILYGFLDPRIRYGEK